MKLLDSKANSSLEMPNNEYILGVKEAGD